jgi:hypothetical protein
LDAEEDPDQEDISVMSNDAGSTDMDCELPHNIQLPHWYGKTCYPLMNRYLLSLFSLF